jgi:hypothetical protein
MPRYFEILWTDALVAYIDQHGVTPEEFEQVLEAPVEETTSRTTGNPIAFGFTASGRKLAIVYKKYDVFTVIPVTAYDVE